MRIKDLRPDVTAWRDGQTLNAGKWHAVDVTHSAYPPALWPQRVVYHYGTEMVRFDARTTEATEWDVLDVSTGWGSVSDQQGVNQLVSDYGFIYRRNGGARIEQVAS